MIGRLGHGQDRGLERGLERKKGEGGGKRAIRALECGEAEGNDADGFGDARSQVSIPHDDREFGCCASLTAG